MNQQNIIDKYALKKVYSLYWGCDVLLPAKRKTMKIDEYFFNFYSDYNILKQCRIVSLGSYTKMSDESIQELTKHITEYDITGGTPSGTLLRSFFVVQFYLRKGYAVPLLELNGLTILESGIGITKEQLEETLKQNK